MKRKSEAPKDDPEQSKRFLDAAKQAEADETNEGAERAFKRVTRRRDDPKAIRRP